MGRVTMSEWDLQRIEVLTDVLAGRRTIAAAATVLAISERQMCRLREVRRRSRQRTNPQGSRPPVESYLNAGIRRYAVELVRSRCAELRRLRTSVQLIQLYPVMSHQSSQVGEDQKSNQYRCHEYDDRTDYIGICEAPHFMPGRVSSRLPY